MEKVNKDQAILEMLQAGKSYTDIVAALNVSPVRIIVLKKKIALKTANIAELKDKIKAKAQDIQKADPNQSTDKQEKEYFARKYDLCRRLSALNDGKNSDSLISDILKNKTKKIRIKLDYYDVERISHREWTLIKTGEL
jgi:predicted nucleic acid-binding protein